MIIFPGGVFLDLQFANKEWGCKSKSIALSYYDDIALLSFLGQYANRNIITLIFAPIINPFIFSLRCDFASEAKRNGGGKERRKRLFPKNKKQFLTDQCVD